MGTTLREILFDIGGGITGTENSKPRKPADLPAAASPTSLLDTPVDYESLANIGSIMGSGGLIVMDETSCMVDVARFFMEFCMDESCGKCIPCRAGTVQMHDILQRITTRRRIGRRSRNAESALPSCCAKPACAVSDRPRLTPSSAR